MELNDHILIDDFLNGKLSGINLEEFNTRMENDADFKVEVEFQEMANLIIVNNERMSIKSQLQQIHSERTISSTNGRKWWGIGSGIVIIGILASIWTTNLNDKKVPLVKTNEISNKKIKNETNSTRNFNVENEEVKISVELEEQTSVEQFVTPEVIQFIDKNEEEQEQTANESNQNLRHIEQEVLTSTEIPGKNKEESIEQNIPQPTIDPCLGINEVVPNYQLIEPCFGTKDGEIMFDGLAENDIRFSEFSIDGGDNYYSSLKEFEVSTGTYQIIAKNNLGCISKMNPVVLNYAECNFVIQPNSDKYWEVDVPQLDDQVIIEIRNARTGTLVYQKSINELGKFIWKGVDSGNNQLSMGNYVYWFKSAKKGVFSKGQVTLVK
jgi:hypothetical protein